ncbi:MAG: tRNA 2-selenouridine(34) synthase MnmH [Clostridia bacterium]|jgi:tRNA 2-selenouridine synthase|nr:tRNA 2-selenouridine(34) synthase MnmH [Clostridiales bacterium]
MKVNRAIDGDYAIIDVRSPGEYQRGTIPGAVNIPLFDDEERALIGTLYKKEGTEEAKKRGIEVVSGKLADIYRQIGDVERQGKEMVVLCSRGGMRSGSLVQLLSSLGHRVHQLEGGYKQYRRYVLKSLDDLIGSKRVVVIHGNTGTGKTELLKMLRDKGFPSVDFEDMANSRGSIFGTVGLGAPRYQKAFEALLFNRLREIEKDYIVVESESPRVGRSYLPKKLVEGMRAGVHILVECSLEKRIRRIVDEYTGLQGDDVLEEIRDSITRLKGELGKRRTDILLALLDRRDYDEIVRVLLVEHYDPRYDHSEKNYDFSLRLGSDNLEECAEVIAEFLENLEGLRR